MIDVSWGAPKGAVIDLRAARRQRSKAAAPTFAGPELQTEQQIQEPLLESSACPNGWKLEDLLHQVHREVADTHRRDVFTNGEQCLEATDTRRRLVALLYEAEILALELDDRDPGTKGTRRYGPGA